jgi:integrase
MRPRLPRYVQVVRAKGSDYLYFRRHGQRWRLPIDPATAEFQKAYLELLSKTDFDAAPRHISNGSVAALIRDYRGSDEFLNLKPKTQRDYGRMLDAFASIDQHPAEDVRRRHIRELRKAFAGKGRTQQLFGQVASLLFNFAVENDYCETNPASRLKRVDKAQAYKAWSDADCAAFEALQPPRHVMTGYMLGRYTGQRRGDVLKMARGAYNSGLIAVKPSKTERHSDANELLFIPAHKRLRAYLAELPMDALLFVVDQAGRPLDETTFSKEFRAALDAASLQHLHFHGLRHTAGAALAEAGCSEKEIMAVLGHKTLSMVQKYTQGARRKRLASTAIAKLEGAGTGTERESGKPDE